jgi:hypothetical protein
MKEIHFVDHEKDAEIIETQRKVSRRGVTPSNVKDSPQKWVLPIPSLVDEKDDEDEQRDERNEKKRRKRHKRKQFRRSPHVQAALDRLQERRLRDGCDTTKLQQAMNRILAIEAIQRNQASGQQSGDFEASIPIDIKDLNELREIVEIFAQYENILYQLVKKHPELKAYVDGRTDKLPRGFADTTKEVKDRLRSLRCDTKRQTQRMRVSQRGATSHSFIPDKVMQYRGNGKDFNAEGQLATTRGRLANEHAQYISSRSNKVIHPPRSHINTKATNVGHSTIRGPSVNMGLQSASSFERQSKQEGGLTLSGSSDQRLSRSTIQETSAGRHHFHPENQSKQPTRKQGRRHPIYEKASRIEELRMELENLRKGGLGPRPAYTKPNRIMELRKELAHLRSVSRVRQAGTLPSICKPKQQAEDPEETRCISHFSRGAEGDRRLAGLDPGLASRTIPGKQDLIHPARNRTVSNVDPPERIPRFQPSSGRCGELQSASSQSFLVREHVDSDISIHQDRESSFNQSSKQDRNAVVEDASPHTKTRKSHSDIKDSKALEEELLELQALLGKPSLSLSEDNSEDIYETSSDDGNNSSETDDDSESSEQSDEDPENGWNLRIQKAFHSVHPTPPKVQSMHANYRRKEKLDKKTVNRCKKSPDRFDVLDRIRQKRSNFSDLNRSKRLSQLLPAKGPDPSARHSSSLHSHEKKQSSTSAPNDDDEVDVRKGSPVICSAPNNRLDQIRDNFLPVSRHFSMPSFAPMIGAPDNVSTYPESEHEVEEEGQEIQLETKEEGFEIQIVESEDGIIHVELNKDTPLMEEAVIHLDRFSNDDDKSANQSDYSSRNHSSTVQLRDERGSPELKHHKNRHWKDPPVNGNNEPAIVVDVSMILERDEDVIEPSFAGHHAGYYTMDDQEEPTRTLLRKLPSNLISCDSSFSSEFDETKTNELALLGSSSEEEEDDGDYEGRYHQGHRNKSKGADLVRPGTTSRAMRSNNKAKDRSSASVFYHDKPQEHNILTAPRGAAIVHHRQNESAFPDSFQFW